MFDWSVFWTIVAVFVVTFLATGAVRHFSMQHSFGHDKDEGVQKFHTQTTSRLGGMGLIVGFFVSVALSVKSMPEVASLGGWLLIACIPVFAGGLIEDLTHRVTPGMRLVLAMASSVFVLFVLGIGVSRTDIFWIDYLLQMQPIFFGLSVLVVSGFINATNIIDGFHGLASGTMALVLLGLAALAHQASDWTLFNLSLLTFAVVMGFFFWNWPLGKIFLGDAGAYILGFWIIELGLMIVNRCSNISPMAPLLVGLYPIVETLFSMYRRKFVRSHPMGHPDSLHLHTLLFRRVVTSNYKVAPYLWTLTILNLAVAYNFANNTPALLSFMLMFTAFYVRIYTKLVRFETPKLLLVLGKNYRR
jgi:UDP-N-acetylmuramyl pentapeptide phosphotransferase/UDP-N-acetylglucosamine-1-phosphate transferase